MKTVLFLILCVLSFPCLGFDTIMVVGGKATDRIVIDVTPCQSSVILDALKPEFKDKLKRALYLYRLKAQEAGYPEKVEGCWLMPPQRPDVLFTIWEDGDRFVVPINALKAGTDKDRLPIKPAAI